MNRRQYKRIHLAQNFLTSPALVRRLVRRARIGPTDFVLEIGPGRGIITAELAQVAGHVVAIEKDPSLASALRERFRSRRNVEIVTRDFLDYRMPVRDHKVFASIPYNRTAAIVRKLLALPARAPAEAYMIMQQEPARKFAGIPTETMFSLLAKPYFEFDLVHRFQREDFRPVPDVDSVMLRIAHRPYPRLAKNGASASGTMAWNEFVAYGFAQYKPNLRLAYKRVFSYKQWKRLAYESGFNINATATELKFNQWLALYRGYVELLEPRKSEKLRT